MLGAPAPVLATIGLYGTMSYAVARRRNEIGLRIALGVERRRVLGLVLRDVGRLLVAGSVAGSPARWPRCASCGRCSTG